MKPRIKNRFPWSITLVRSLFFFVILFLSSTFGKGAAAEPGDLRCEYRANPQGIDEPHPSLSWVINSARRGEIQTAYQILVASRADLLADDRGDLWDSGKVLSHQSTLVAYAGGPLPSQASCFWKVRVWDKDGQPTEWSQPSSWTMGLLTASDWTAQWISDPVLANPTNRPLTPIHCYRSELSSRPETATWVVLDLGTAKKMDAIDLVPARPPGENSDFRTAMFPLRFKVETAARPDFSDARLVIDQTGADVPNPRGDSCRLAFSPVTARYVRLTVTKLSRWDGLDYGLALGALEVFDGAQLIDAGAGVSCSDSMESDLWSKRFLANAPARVELAPASPALDAGAAGVRAKNTVSRVPMLRREFTLGGKVRRAVLHVSARGFYEVRLNGQKVGDELLAPGYTDYNARLQYQTHDVTALVHPGQNAIGALLGYGWYAGHMNLFDMRCIYGYFPQFLAQLEVEMEDGTHRTVNSDSQWRSTLDGPVRWSDLLDGEGYDGRREMPGWDQPGFDDHAWLPVWTMPRDETPLVAQYAQPVRAIGELRPVSTKEVSPGVYVFDLGQEITGWCRLRVDGAAGTHIRLRHAELVSPDGNIDVQNLWGTPQEDDYILDGHGPHTFEPHFTYHGFRYVELTGLTGGLKPETLVAINLRTAAPIASEFRCSNELFNRIQQAAFWTQANLIFDVPAGCAARAERLAWTGDIRPCVQSLLFNFDAAALLAKYTADLRDDQATDGRFTDICPQAHLLGTTTCVGSPGWADAGVSLPWDLYVNTGDRRVLAQHFAAARRWVDVIHASNPDLIWRNNRGMDWGDWMSAGPATPKELGATAFFAHSADLVARMARALGRDAEAAHYKILFNGIRTAFVKKYASSTGIIGGSSPGKPAMRDVTGIVRALIHDRTLSFTVNNDTLGGDPALNQIKNLHLILRHGNQLEEQIFVEGARAEASAETGQTLEITSATYGFDATDLGDVQGSYALALDFGLLDEPLRSLAAQRLDELAVRNKHHPTTGFWSSVELMLALSDRGYNDETALMLDQHDMPSWGYMAEHSTTFWEAFDANTRNLSLNHWTHSAINEWLWRNVAGLNPDEESPGYAAFTLRPRPTPEVSWCRAKYNSIHGTITSDWKCEGKAFSLTVTIPANTTATVAIPTTEPATVRESGKLAAEAEGVSFWRSESGAEVYHVGSGVYHFTAQFGAK